MSVRKLPEEVQSLLRTGININCPSQCVIELVLNAIDAGATSIAVRVDLRYFKFQVVDNGHGMDLENIDRVGSRYMTSKCHTLQDLYSHLDFFGFRGEALASLRELSGILALESRPSGNEQTYCKVFTHGKSHRAGLANTKRPSFGTTVTVTDFMYNMPVRRKRIKEAVDLEEIKSQLECIALMHPQVSISLRNDVKYNIIMQTHRTTDTLKVFSNLFGDTISKSLVPVLFELDRFKVSGYIGKSSHPQKNLQFIYVNKRLILKSKLHKLVNAVLAKSFILRANGPWRNAPISKKLDSRFFIACSPPEKRSKYGVYVLNVECSYCDYDIALDPRKTLVEFKDWDSILKCTEEAVRSFLEKESLVFSGDLDSDYRSSPSRDVGKFCDESLICEMDQLSKECALALSDHTSKLIDTNTFMDPPSKSVGVDALNAAGMVHGLPARRKAFVKEKILASSLPQSPNIFNTALNVDNQASKLNLFESTLVSEVEKFSENPLPSSTFSESILSSKGLKRKCDKSDIKSKKHFVKPAIPQKKHKCSINKINCDSSRATSVSADSEDPLFSCKHYLTKSKPKDNLRSLPKLTKGKIKNFSFKATKQKFQFPLFPRSPSLASSDRSIMSKLEHIKKQNQFEYLNKFSFGTSLDKRLTSTKITTEHSVAATQTDFSENDLKIYSSCIYATPKNINSEGEVRKVTQTNKSGQDSKAVQTNLSSVSTECRLTPCESQRKNGSSFVCEIKTSTAVQTSASLDKRPAFFSDIIASVPGNEGMLNTASYPILRPTSRIIPNETFQQKSFLFSNNTASEPLSQNIISVDSNIGDHTIVPIRPSQDVSKQTSSENVFVTDGVNIYRNKPSKTVTFHLEKNTCLSFSGTSCEEVSPVHGLNVGQSNGRTFFKHDALARSDNIHRAQNSRPRTNIKIYDVTKIPDHQMLCVKNYMTSLDFLCTVGSTMRRLNPNKQVANSFDISCNSSQSSLVNSIHNYYNYTPNDESIDSVRQRMKKFDRQLNEEFGLVIDEISGDGNNDSSEKIPSSPPAAHTFTCSQSFQPLDISHRNVSDLQECVITNEPINCIISTPDNTITDKTLSVDSHDISTINDPYNADNEITISGSTCSFEPTMAFKDIRDKSKGLYSSYNTLKTTSNFDSYSYKNKICLENYCQGSNLLSKPLLQDAKSSNKVVSENIIQATLKLQNKNHNSNKQSSKIINHNPQCNDSNSENIYLVKSKLNHPETESNTNILQTEHTKMSTPVTVSSGSIPCGQDGKTPNNSPRIISPTYSKYLFSNFPTQINSGATNLIDGSPFLIKDHHIGSSEMIMNEISTELCSKDYDTTGSQNHCVVEGDKSKLSSPIKEVNNANMINLTQQSNKHCPSSSFVCETINNGKSSPMMHAANDSTTLAGTKRNNEISHDNNLPCKKIHVDDVTLTLPFGTNKSPCLSAKQTDVLSLSVTSQELIRAMDDAMQSMSNCGVLANCIPLNSMADSVAVNAMEAMPEPQVACLIDLEPCKGSEDSSNINQWMKATDNEGSVFYVHKRSGITSFDAPVPTQDQVSFSMINRCSFLPKGMSPILKTSSCKPIKNDASLVPPSCHMMKDVISRSNSLQDELAVIKWRDLLEVQDSGYKPYVTQLLDDAENRMKYCEQPVPNAKIIDKCAINIYNVMFPYAFTREMFSSIKVLGQMDKKFIVTLASVAGSNKPHVIVLFDQHAVHERIRLEKLMKDYQIDGSNTHFRSTEITPPLSLSLSSTEVRILSSFEEEFGRLGLYYQLTNETQIYVTKIPTCLQARESREASRGNTVVKSLLEALIREQVEVLLDTRGVGTRVPSVLQNIISSEACRGAVKFGHELSVEESRVLLKYLGQCELPFQCAHGRPALAPIADLAIIDRDTAPVTSKPRLGRLKHLIKI